MPSPITPHIVAEVTLFPGTEGGREGPIRSGEYRGVLGVGTEHFSFRAVVPLVDGFHPGQTARLGIQFLVPEGATEHFQVGAGFSVWEGRSIGRGTVLEVLPMPKRVADGHWG
jgi:hypothetical protein